MSSAWKRPNTLKFPKIWHTFKAKDTESDELVNYYIQDLPKNRYEDAMSHMIECFLKEEPMCVSKNILGHPDSIEDIKDLWKKILKQNIVIVCFKEGCDEIAGLNMIGVVLKDDNDEKTKVIFVNSSLSMGKSKLHSICLELMTHF